MMKLTIFVCLALAAICSAKTIPSQANDLDELIKLAELYDLPEGDVIPAGIWDSLKSKAKELKNEIKNTLKKLKDGIEKTVTEAVDSVPKLISELKEKANEITKKVYQDVEEKLQKLDVEIEKLTGRAEGVDVTECTQMAAQLHDSAGVIIEEVGTCVGEKIEEGSELVEKSKNMSETFIREIRDIHKNAAKCSENAGDDVSVKIIGCLGRALKEAVKLGTSTGPAVLKHVAEIKLFVKKAIPSLADCSVTKSVSTFLEQVDSVVPRVEACIEQKIRNAEQSATPKYY